MNQKYRASSDPSWDLRCSAAFGSLFFAQWKQQIPEAFRASACGASSEDACWKSLIPTQCPRVDETFVLGSEFVFEDFVFYSHDNVFWSDKFQIIPENAFPTREIMDAEDSDSLDIVKNTVIISAQLMEQMFQLMSSSQQDSSLLSQLSQQLGSLLSIQPSLIKINCSTQMFCLVSWMS